MNAPASPMGITPERTGQARGFVSTMLSVILMVAIISATLGWREGRITECRRGWRTMDEVPAVWAACRARLGLRITDLSYDTDMN